MPFSQFQHRRPFDDQALLPSRPKLAQADDVLVLERRQRIAMACTYCRRRKIKCNGALVCANCYRYGRECEYSKVSDADNRLSREKKATARALKASRLLAGAGAGAGAGSSVSVSGRFVPFGPLPIYRPSAISQPRAKDEDEDRDNDSDKDRLHRHHHRRPVPRVGRATTVADARIRDHLRTRISQSRRGSKDDIALLPAYAPGPGSHSPHDPPFAFSAPVVPSQALRPVLEPTPSSSDLDLLHVALGLPRHNDDDGYLIPIDPSAANAPGPPTPATASGFVWGDPIPDVPSAFVHPATLDSVCIFLTPPFSASPRPRTISAPVIGAHHGEGEGAGPVSFFGSGSGSGTLGLVGPLATDSAEASPATATIDDRFDNHVRSLFPAFSHVHVPDLEPFASALASYPDRQTQCPLGEQHDRLQQYYSGLAGMGMGMGLGTGTGMAMAMTMATGMGLSGEGGWTYMYGRASTPPSAPALSPYFSHPALAAHFAAIAAATAGATSGALPAAQSQT